MKMGKKYSDSIKLLEKAKLYDEALAFNAPLKVCQFGKQEGIFELENSFVAIEGDNLILSSVTKSTSPIFLLL